MFHTVQFAEPPPGGRRILTPFDKPKLQGHGMDQFITHFVRIESGRWTCIKSGEYTGPNGRVQFTVGSTFIRGTSFMGFDLALNLDEYYDTHTKL
jgi:hypothetical protein